MRVAKRGFTLVEALVVVILIALGAALAFSFYDKVVVEGREKAAAAYAIDSARTIGEAAGAYYLRTGEQVTDLQQLVASGDLKAIPDTSRLLAKTEIPSLLNTVYAAGSLSYILAYDNTYRLDGTPEGVDGYINIINIVSAGICKEINNNLGLGSIIVETSCPEDATLDSSGQCISGSTSIYPAIVTKTGGVAFTTPYYYVTDPANWDANPQYKGTIIYPQWADIGSKVVAGYGPVKGVVLSGGKGVANSLYGAFYRTTTFTVYSNIAASPEGISDPVPVYGAVRRLDQTPLTYYLSTEEVNRETSTLQWLTSPLYGYLSKTPDSNVGGTASYSCNPGDTLNPDNTCTHGTSTSSPIICPAGQFVSTSGKCEVSGGYCYDAGDGTYTFHYPFAVQ